MQLSELETLPKFRVSVQSLYAELGDSLNKHATITNLSRHVAKHDREFVRDVVKAFIKAGLLRKHRTDTFCWTAGGLAYARRVLSD
ncbi:MAG: hypothetical protein HY394_05265 [Candidatus Diapherotrites archaeon]|nr:hypothetical protein [Candidatus Diapherotrites archaeon]